MLKGNIKCSDIPKLLLGYIHFELNRQDMNKVAIHLRNCPLCMEKYSKIQKRKTELKDKMVEIEKKLRMQLEISSYIDGECSDSAAFIVEGMLIGDENYKKQFIEFEKTKILLLQGFESKKNSIRPVLSEKIIQNMKRKKYSLNRIIRLWKFLFRGIVKFG